MSDRDFTYEWNVRVRHAEKGFGRSFDVVGRTYQQAVDGAKNGLRDQGYDAVDQEAFDFVEIRRGKIVSRVSDDLRAKADDAIARDLQSLDLDAVIATALAEDEEAEERRIGREIQTKLGTLNHPEIVLDDWTSVRVDVQFLDETETWRGGHFIVRVPNVESEGLSDDDALAAHPATLATDLVSQQPHGRGTLEILDTRSV